MSVLALGLAACTERAPYWTPEGSDASVSGSWTVRGAPADATSCAAAGLATVQLVFAHDGADVDVGTFTFPCAQGAFDSGGPALAAGTYVVHWHFLALADAGGTESATAPVTIVATAGGHVDVPPGDAL